MDPSSQSSGESYGVERLVSGEEDPSNPDIFIHLSPLLTVRAPATMLVKVPYFATRLAEPWIDSPPQLKISLECTPGTSPEDYLQCLRFLTSPPASWPPLQASVSEVLRVLRVADHLLFQECWDVCMAVLASSAWSIEEEDAICATVSDLNMKPSPDVQDRLIITSHDGATFKQLFDKMLRIEGCEDHFITMCEKYLNHSSGAFAAAFHSILWKVMTSFPLRGSLGMALPREWYVLAKILLRFTDSERFILFLVDVEELLQAMSEDWNRAILGYIVGGQPRPIFDQVLEKVEKRVVLLSNLQRARLVKWLGCCLHVDCEPWYPKLERLAETLPIGDRDRMSVVLRDKNIMKRSMSHICHRLIQMDEASLEAACEEFDNSSTQGK